MSLVKLCMINTSKYRVANIESIAKKCICSVLELSMFYSNKMNNDFYVTN